MQENQYINDDQEDLKSLAPILSGIKKGQSFQVPEHYFDALSGRILDKIEDMEVFEAAPVLSALPKVNPFLVPDAYFDELGEAIQAEIRLAQLKAETAPEPAFYFEGLAQEVENRIILDKLSIQKEEPFAVPADYFEWLPSLIQDKILAAQSKQRFSLAWLQQLLVPRVLVPAALSFVILVFFGIRLLNSGSDVPAVQTAQVTLTAKDKQEVKENPDLYGIDESTVIEHAATEEKTDETKPTSTDKEAAIDYLIDNNVDVSALNTDNP
jgi:hypothetical protein